MNLQNYVDYSRMNRSMINMIPIEGIIDTGVSMGLDENTTVLDLCCGYGTQLMLWAKAFGCSGVGVDITQAFVEEGQATLGREGIHTVELLQGDVMAYQTDTLFDVVCCTENLVQDIGERLRWMERYAKPEGKLVISSLYAKVENPPAELTDFDGPLLTLDALYDVIREAGFYLTSIALDSPMAWNTYISWSSQRDLAALRKNPDDARLMAWIEKWNHMYFRNRIPYEGMAMCVVERL